MVGISYMQANIKVEKDLPITYNKCMLEVLRWADRRTERQRNTRRTAVSRIAKINTSCR